MSAVLTEEKVMGSEIDQWLARVCECCPVCRQARCKPKGIAYRFVRRVEKDICPFCRAYERVNGRPACEGKTG